MKNNRRQFLLDVSLTATALTVTSTIGAAKTNRRREIINCAPTSLSGITATISTVKSGKWSDSSVWSGGRIPSSVDTLSITAGHSITFDLATATVAGVRISGGATLSFDPLKSVTLQTSRNVVVEGKLQMRPSTSVIIHTLQFINVNENAFAGGGMSVLESDVGLWVMGAGTTDIIGATKTSWTKATGSISSGATSITVENAAGWKVGDTISIAPTEPPTAGSIFATGFDECTIRSISGNTIGLSKSTVRPHPVINSRWTAEVMNLTRNVRIEGTVAGRAHIFIHANANQVIRYASIRFMGPRKDANGDGVKELVAGRYGMHFHHCMNGTRGSLIEGNVIADTNNHSYVPHVSHGIKFLNNIAYRVLETAFWWDPGDATHDILFDHNIVANCRYVRDSLNMNAEMAPTFSSSGFALNTGDGNACNNNVVVAGGIGDAADGGAYNWEAVVNEGIWAFVNNIAHNNDCGLRVWQNSTRNHVIEDFFSYHNVVGMFHGAYANSYTYTGGYFYGNGMQIKAASVNSNRVRIENITIDGAGIANYGIEVIHSPLPGEKPVFVRNVTIRNCKVAAILDSAAPEVHSTDLVQCNISGNIQVHSQAAALETIRVQPVSGTPYKLTKSGKVSIAPFAAAVWGTGKGLKGEYFKSTNFTNHAFTRIDSNISFTEWSAGVHYALTNTYSIRWTGKVQAQFTEAYTFFLSSGGGHRLWLNGKLILDSWAEHYPDTYQSPPQSLQAGALYDIKVEYFNNDARTGLGLLWSSKSQLLEYIPQSQLYASTTAAAPAPTSNRLPVAKAGADITITLPVNNTTLNGSASIDPEGGLLKYAWSKVSGPLQYVINSKTSANTTVTGLVQGTYVFRLVVTDDKGATHQDDVTVRVLTASTANKPPVAVAGNDITITTPTSSVTLNGSMSSDPDGTITAYGWQKISGPTSYNITSPTSATTSVTALSPGVYVFRLTVRDSKNATDTDDVTVTVNQQANNANSTLTFTASPNPSTSYFALKVTASTPSPVTLGLYDANGRLLQVITSSKGSGTFYVGHSWYKGTYYAVAEQGDVRRIITLIKS